MIAITVSIIVGKLRGGRIASLGEMPIKGLPFIFGALALEVALNLAGYAGVVSGARAPALTVIAHVGSYILLFYGIARNLALTGMGWILAGSALNAVVIVANGGRMPVSEKCALQAGLASYLVSLKEGRVPTHTLLDSGTRLWFLGDVLAFPSNPVWTPSYVFSLGDVFIMVGLFVLIQFGMSRGRRPRFTTSRS